MKHAAAIALMLAGCTRSGVSEKIATQTQAVVLPFDSVTFATPTHSFFAQKTGSPMPQLGTSISACPNGGFVAGAGGYWQVSIVDADYSAMVWNGAGVMQLGLGRDVECVDGTTWLAAGENGVYRTGEPNPLLEKNAYSMVRTGVGLLVGAEYSGTGCVFVLTDAGHAPLVCGDGGTFGQAIAVDEEKPQLAVGSPGQDKVELFEPGADGGMVLKHTLEVPTAAWRGGGFGSSLAYGNVAAAPGRELLVGASDGVSIFNTAPHLVLSLEFANRGSNGGFDGPPVAIAVEPVPLGNWPVRHYWLGLPLHDTVARCIGTSCTTFTVSDPISAGTFIGASLAIDGTTLLVGAPGWENGGAVFGFTAELGGNLTDGGFAKECGETGKACDCGYVCLGGVVCVPANIAECVTDAGEPMDAGEQDAGLVEKDAGVNDAGAWDAGPLPSGELLPAEFAARGCTSTAALPLVLLGLLVLRRKRSRCQPPAR